MSYKSRSNLNFFQTRENLSLVYGPIFTKKTLFLRFLRFLKNSSKTREIKKLAREGVFGGIFILDNVGEFIILSIFRKLFLIIPDTYRNYAELSAHHIEGIDYTIEAHQSKFSDILIAMPHGGYIEPGTTEIGRSIAEKYNYSWYSFSGCMATGNSVLHITSQNFDEPIAIELAQKSRLILTLHGFKKHPYDIIVSGGNSLLRDKMIESFTHANYRVPPHGENNFFPGDQKNNICNLGHTPGIQLELSQAFRKKILTDPVLLGDFSTIVDEIIQL